VKKLIVKPTIGYVTEARAKKAINEATLWTKPSGRNLQSKNEIAIYRNQNRIQV